MERDYKIVTDSRRHMVTIPYSRINLDKAAQELGIKKGWLHRSSGNLHYDIPKKMHDDARVYKIVDIVTSTANIIRIIKGQITGIEQLKNEK